MNRLLRGLVAVVLGYALIAGSASAAVTVNLRVEGSSETLYEGQITTDAETFALPSSNGPHPCDYAHNGPQHAVAPQGTPTTALHDAAVARGLALDGQWFDSFREFLISRVGSDVGNSSTSWGLEINDQDSASGGCSTLLTGGEDVLWAYAPFGAPLLKLTGPATVDRGTPTTFTVVNGRDGSPVAGASVGGATTDAAGHATLTFDQTGTTSLKATHADDVRSNRLDVCVHDGDDGTCAPPTPGQTPSSSAPSSTPASATAVRDTTPPVARIAGVRNHAVLPRGKGPRVLRGSVDEAGGILMVKLRLERRVNGHCWYFSGRFERFRGARCGRAKGEWFRIGDSASWSYLLPKRLPRGRYTLDVNAVDKAYNRDDARRAGANEVKFVVR